MAEEQVNGVMAWLDELEKKGNQVDLPDSIQRTQNMVIEIEEIIETIEIRRPNIGANEQQSVQIIEKYDAVRRWREDDNNEDNDHIKQLQERINQLECNVEQMKIKFTSIVDVYLKLRDALIRHLASLRTQSDTSEIRRQMNELATLLNLICEKMIISAPNELSEATAHVDTLHQLHSELDTAKESVLEATSTSRQKSQNTNIAEDEAKELHKQAGSLDDHLGVTSTRLVDCERLHCAMRELHKDFEKRETGLMQFIEENEKKVGDVNTKRDSLHATIDWLEELSRVLQGDKMTDLKLLQLTVEKYESVQDELNSFNNSSTVENGMKERYKTIAKRNKALSEQCTQQHKRLKRIANALKSFDREHQVAASYLAEIEERWDSIQNDTLRPDTIVEQAATIKSFAQSVMRNEPQFCKLETVDFDDLDGVECEHLQLLATDLTSRFKQVNSAVQQQAESSMNLATKRAELDRLKSNIEAERGFFERSLKDATRPGQASQSVYHERLERLENARTDFESSVAEAQQALSIMNEPFFDEMRDQMSSAIDEAFHRSRDVEKVLQATLDHLIKFDSDHQTLVKQIRDSSVNIESAKEDADNLSIEAEKLKKHEDFNDVTPIDTKLDEVDNLLRQLLTDEAERLRKIKEQLELNEQYESLLAEIKKRIESVLVPSSVEIKSVSNSINDIDKSLEQLNLVDFDHAQTIKSRLDALEVSDQKPLVKLLNTKKQQLKLLHHKLGDIATKHSQWIDASQVAIASIEQLSPANLIKTSTDVGEALRIGRDLVKTASNVANTKVTDLSDFERQVSALEHGFVQAQAKLENKARLCKLRDEFDAKYESAKEWIGDQIAQVAMMKTVPELEMILEPQKLQVVGIQNESSKRRPRVNRLKEISTDLTNEKQAEIDELETEWNELDEELFKRKEEISTTLAILNGLNKTNHDVVKFINDLDQVIQQDFTKIMPNEDNIASLTDKLRTKSEQHARFVESAAETTNNVSKNLPNYTTNGRVKTTVGEMNDALDKCDLNLRQLATNLDKLKENVKHGNDMKSTIRKQLNDAKKNPNLTKEDVNEMRETFDEFANQVDKISELANRPTDLRDDKRHFLAELAELDKLVDERVRDEARRAKKSKIMNELLAECKRQVDATKTGDTMPDSIRQKQQTVVQMLSDLESRESDFVNLSGFDRFAMCVDQIRLRRNELEQSHEPSQLLLGEFKSFNEWYDKTMRLFEKSKAFDVEKLKV